MVKPNRCHLLMAGMMMRPMQKLISSFFCCCCNINHNKEHLRLLHIFARARAHVFFPQSHRADDDFLVQLLAH